MARNGQSPQPGLISILCPTRKRPLRVQEMVRSALATASRPDDLEFIFRIDADDLASHAIQWPAGVRCLIFTGKRQIQPDNWNDAYKLARADILMVGADDLNFLTAGWDDAVRGAFAEYPDGVLLAQTGAGPQHKGPVQATHPFLGRAWVDTLGYVCPPYFEVYWSDQWLQELADRTHRRKELVHVDIDHVHWMGGRAPHDDTYKDAQEWEARAQPGKVWVRTANVRVEDAAKLEAAIESAACQPVH